jgi:hypothetical protein
MDGPGRLASRDAFSLRCASLHGKFVGLSLFLELLLVLWK